MKGQPGQGDHPIRIIPFFFAGSVWFASGDKRLKRAKSSITCKTSAANGRSTLGGMFIYHMCCS